MDRSAAILNLQPMPAPAFDAARLDVNLAAVTANYRTCQRLAAPAAAAGVVKADAYGMGMAPVARALAAAGCGTFFVARLEEGVALRPLVPAARIFVLDGAPRDAIPALTAHRLTPVLNALEQVADWQAAARAGRAVREAAIHIDTGMNRLGLTKDELDTLAADAPSWLGGLDVVLWMSHLACADDPAHPMNGEQLARFRAALARLPPAPASLASSGGVLLGRGYAFDLVRPGIALYGGNPHGAGANPFAAVAHLSAKILQLRRVDGGESVGYGATHRIAGPTTLATVSLGYADGLMRAVGNRGAGAIAGHRVPVVGRVSMDLVTLDVGAVPTDLLSPGADVEFLGGTIALEELAAAANTAPYEILTGIGARVPRHYTGAAA